jgi:hypothetical protein
MSESNILMCSINPITACTPWGKKLYNDTMKFIDNVNKIQHVINIIKDW